MIAVEYPKTENLYASNGEQNASRKRGPEFGFKALGVDQISKWLVTEKVDGTNMRVIFTPAVVAIHGRTDRAQIPGDLLSYMQETFTVEAMMSAFDTHESDEYPTLPDRVILYGEGFGPGIQKAGQAYGGTKRFILFDVVVNDTWLKWDDIEDIARKLGIPTVPVLSREATLEDAKLYVRSSQLLPADSEHIEGIVCRTDPYLFDQFGKRVMFKYKVRDLT